MLTRIGEASSAINEFERTNLLERQKEGIAEAKKNGVYKGRKEISIPDEVWNDLYGKYMNRQITKKDFADRLKISRPTLDKLLKQKTA